MSRQLDIFSGTVQQQTTGKPILCGMNNPLSSDPRYALAPYPVNVTGWRIWQMLHEHTGCHRSEYMRAFDRRNALSARHWDFNAAREQCRGLVESLRNRKLVVLGRDTLSALGLRGTVPPLEWQHDGSLQWCYMPHPSGLNLWYNDDLHRVAAGLRLEQLYEESNLS